MATLPIMAACSADKPCYSYDEVIVILKQQLQLDNGVSLTQDRYGASLVGKPIVVNFRLSDWEAKYLKDGKWQVSANASYYESFSKQTCKCSWHFYEKGSTIQYIGNGE